MASLRQQYYQTYLEFKQSDAFKSLSAEERAQIQKAAKQTYQELSEREKPAPTGQEIRDERGVLSNVVTDLTAGAVNLGRSGVSAAAWGADIAGLPDAAKALDEKSKQMGETSQMISPPADPNRLMSFGSQAVLQNAPTLAAGGVLTKLLTGSATGGAILNNLRNAAGIPAIAGAAPLTEGAASLISSTGLYGIPAVRQANVEYGGKIREGNPYAELLGGGLYGAIESAIGITPLKTMRAFSGSAAPAGIAKTLAANAGKLSTILEKPLFELSGKAGIRGMIGAFSRFVGENMLGESTEEIFQAIEETAIPHFTKKPIDQAIRDTLADLGKPEVVDLLTQAKGGALVGGVLGGGNAIARRLTRITEEINNPETTPEEAQRLASLKKQYREQPVLQLPYDQSIPTVQPSGPVIDDAVITSFRPETERVSTPQEILLDRTTEGTDRDYAAYQQEKQAKKEQPATPISLAKKWLEVRNLPDSDPKKQKIMKLMADRGLLAPEPMKYPKGPEGKKLQALDDAEVMPENLATAEIAPETPMLEFQQDKAEGRALADEGGVILPIKTTDAITLKSGKPFASEKAAKGYQAKNSLKESHDIVPVRGGFVLMKKSEPGDVRRVTVETPRGGTYDKMDIRVEGTTVPTNRMKLSGTSSAAARIEKRLTQNVNENVQGDPIPVALEPIKQPESAVEPKSANAEPKQQEAVKQPVTKSDYKTESYQGGFRVLDPEGKQYSWHTSKQAAEDKAGELNKSEAIPSIQPQKPGESYKEKTQTISEIVQAQLNGKQKININELMNVANEVFEGTQANGKWNIKDLYDSMELGVNLHLLRDPEYASLFNQGKISEFVEKVKKEILENIPTQTKRTEEMDEFQQFSTPPSIAAMVGWLANINSRDTVLEPSAGIGGLAVFGKLAGANVVVNEFSKRRAEVLGNMPFDRVFTENGEQLNNILPDDVTPTVVVMNPPFSSTAGRIQGQRKTMNGGIHVEQALKKLQPGGRLVAIVGDGMSFEHSTFKDWWAKIRKEYNVKANIGLSGQEYKKYGTTFDNRILVIDKTGETTGQPVVGSYNNIEGALKALEGVRNERPAVSRTAESTEGTNQQKGASASEEVRPSSGKRPSSSPGSVSSSATAKTDTAPKTDKRSTVSGDTGRTNSQKPRKSDEISGADKTIQPGSKTGNAGINAEGNGRNTSPESIRKDREPDLELSKAESAKNTELTDSIYDEYKPSTSIKGAQKHPGKLVESAAMAAVSPAKVSYVPKIPKEAIDAGKISDAQLEAVIRAGHNHNQKLMDGKRKGFFIGDGTGVGKGREISAVFWDNWNQGRKRGVWITKNNGLFNSAKRDIEGIGWDKNVALTLKDYEDIPDTDGILLVSYDTLKGASKKDGRTRLEQIEKWLGDNFDGVIAFDEAHMMANGIDVKGARGTKKASQKALKALDFRNNLPNSRVLYVSATGATEPTNLGYLERLGLWGPGTAFANLNKFINEVVSGGVAVMEMIAADMKAMGAYMARSLSFDGVTYDRLEHSLTPQQQQIYNVYSKSWQKVLQNIDEALEAAGAGKSGSARSSALAAFWSANQRFFNQILTSLQMPSLIKDIEKQLAAGNSIVLQLTSTNEAQLTRELSGMEEEDALEDLDLTPTEIISQFVESSFPVHQMEEYMDQNGNRQFRYVVDSAGNRVLNKEAVAMRDRLLDELGSIKKLDGPLDMIVNHFGSERVAEITGRTKRLVWKEGRRVLEKRGKSHTDSDESEFMEGKKRILVFSEAGGTGRSFHADNTAKNRQRRIHYLVQAGWRADVAIQGLGRTHRTNEASQPHYVLVSTNVPAQVRFTSTIARRLDQLGALTRGSRQTGGQGLFQAKDNLESDYAKQAITAFIFDLYRNDQIGGISFDEFRKQSGLKLTDSNGFVSENTIAAIPVPQFLNRTLSLDLDVQNELYEQVFDRLSTIIEIAAARGDLDVGMETIRAKKITEQRSDIVRTDQESGARTEYHYLIQENDARYTAFPEKAYGYYLNEKTGKVGAVTSEARSKADGDGIHDTYYQFSTLKNEYDSISDSQAAKLKKISKEEARELWQAELSEAPKTVKSPLHIISGALLPVWDRLPSNRKKVVRVKTDYGKVILGRVISHKEINATLAKLGVGSNTFDVAESIKQLMESGDEITLANNWKLRRKTVAGEKRIEVTNLEYGDQEEIKVAGGFVERIQFETRAFIPVANAAEILEKIVKNKPIISVGNPTENAPLYSAEYLAAKYTAKAVKAGWRLIKSGITKFADWAREMLRQFGKSIGSKLRAMYADLQSFNKRLGRTGAISNRPAGKMATRPAEMKDFKWNKENYRVVHLEYISPYTGVVSRVAKLLKVDNKWEWVGTNRAFLTLATATKTVRSEIFEKLRNTERQQEKIQKVAADKRARQTVKVEKYLSQPSPSEATTSKDLPQTITAKIERFADRVTRALADRRLALKKYQELIELNRGQPLPDWENPYERFDTLDGRVEAAKNEFKELHWKPLQDFLNENKISYKDFNSFAYAMHAKERNDYINSINPAFRERGIPGSGWSDKKAEEVKKDLFSRFKEETLMEAGKMFWSMHKELLNEQVKYGLLDEETKDIIEKKYQYYTPLKKIRDNTVLLDQRALGMRSEAEHQLMFSLAAIDTTFGRGEYNRVMQSLARLILLNPAPEIYEMQKDKLKPFFDERTGEVDYRLDIYADRENTVHAKFFGRDVSVVIKDPDLLSAIKSKSSVEAEKLFRLIRPLNKVMSAVNTAWSPDFILTNIARDVQTAFAHAAIVNSADMAKKILKSVPASVKTAYQYHQGVKNAETALYKEFIREGGKTGYNDIYQLQAMAEKLEKQMNERMADGAWFKTKEGIAKVASLVSAANDIAESATRFSGYKTAVEAGLSKQKAAAFAKNLTVNFNKRGTYGTLVNSLYVFGNAALQGSFLTAKLTYRMAKSEKGRIALGSMIALGAAMDMLNRLLSGYDEEEGKSYYDKIDASFKDNNLIVMLSDGYYFSLPLAYGLNVLPALGRNVSAYLFGDQTLRETGNNIIGTGMAAFNPMGNDNRGFLFNLLPSAARPFFDLKTNSKWTGKKIKPDQPLFGADLPQSQLFYDQTNKHLVKFTQWLNEAFGGNKIDSAGWPVDLSPADIQHLLETFAGGVGKTVMRSTDSIARLVNGEPVPVENLPIIRRFAGKAKDYNVYDDFRENAQIALRVQRAKSGKDLDWLRSNRESVAVADVYKKTQKTIEKINDNGRMTDQEKEAELLSEKKRFNKKVRDIMQKNLSKN